MLVAWELGGGHGHVNRLLPIARELHASGAHLVFALREMSAGQTLAGVLPGVQIVQAPFFHPVNGSGAKMPACNYADVLYLCGYDSTSNLFPLVATWQRLFDAVRPNLILCDHSPTTILAVARRFPIVHIGSGFATPPAGEPFLVLRPSAVNGAREREAQVLESMHAVQRKHSLPAPQSVADLFGWCQNLACTFPELDPYRTVRRSPAIGAVEPLPPSFPCSPEPSIFAYLNGADGRTVHVLQEIAHANIVSSVYIRRPTPECIKAMAGSEIRIFPHPPALAQVIPRASAVLHHGGVATTEFALATGRPQLIFPRHLEQTLTADAVCSIGCGINLRDQKKALRLVLSHAATSTALSIAAQRISFDLHGQKQMPAKEIVANECIMRLI